jgi:tRNA(Glu) U13 pseudouridine synthase TruD
MTQNNDFESPYYNEIRNNINNNWGNWLAISEILEPFHYYFCYEKAVAKAMINRPNDYLNALGAIQSQTQIFVYAYFSYLFNKVLSDIVKNNENMPDQLPLYRPIESTRQFYLKYFSPDEFDGIDFYNQPPYLNIRKEQFVQTKIYPKINKYSIEQNCAIIDFELGKGAYATTFLQNLFTLSSGWPKPDWITDEKIDSKKILGSLPVIETESLFKEFSEDEKLNLEE